MSDLEIILLCGVIYSVLVSLFLAWHIDRIRNQLRNKHR